MKFPNRAPARVGRKNVPRQVFLSRYALDGSSGSTHRVVCFNEEPFAKTDVLPYVDRDLLSIASKQTPLVSHCSKT